jgi:acetyltransferase-like isoleucine patch superfamily enzyme
VIEDDVFVGMQSIILKGVTIGSGSVVGAGSVVTRNVPPGVVVAGNPAQVIKKLDANL